MPRRTAALYYGVWSICLTIKICFGYYLLALPLVKPISFITSADLSCWTPWSGDSINPMCATTLDEQVPCSG